MSQCVLPARHYQDDQLKDDEVDVHVEFMEEMRKSFKMLVWKPVEKLLLWRLCVGEMTIL